MWSKWPSGKDKVLHSIAVFANDKALFLRLGSSVHHFEHIIKQETLIFAKMTNN